MNNENNNWYPVRVKPNMEYASFTMLLKKGFKAYSPFLRYEIKKNEKNIWKIKPIFKGYVFVHCSKDEIIKLSKEEDNYKPVLKKDIPEFIEEKHINFIKKALLSDDVITILKKEPEGTIYQDIDTGYFGSIILKSTMHNENEVLSWEVPVIKNSFIFDKESAFIKYIKLESQATAV